MIIDYQLSKFYNKVLQYAGSRDPVDKVGTSETKTETETWAAETKTETEAIEIRSRGRPRGRGRSSGPPSLPPPPGTAN